MKILIEYATPSKPSGLCWKINLITDSGKEFNWWCKAWSEILETAQNYNEQTKDEIA